jgi:hypothetical protein
LRKDGKLLVRWSNVVDGFNMPVRVRTDEKDDYTFVYPTDENWTITDIAFSKKAKLEVDPNFYVEYE